MAARLVLSDDELAKIGTVVPKRTRLVLDDVVKVPRRIVGAGWDESQVNGVNVDVDLITVMATLLEPGDPEPTQSGLYVASNDRIVRFNPQDRRAKVRDASGAVEYQGDSVDGAASKDNEDETSIFDYPRMPGNVDALITFVDIHKEMSYPPFIRSLTFDQIGRAFASSWPENDPTQKRVISLSDSFAGTDTVVVNIQWRKRSGNPDDADTWEEEFVEQYVPHLPQFKGNANAGYRSALYPYGVELKGAIAG